MSNTILSQLSRLEAQHSRLMEAQIGREFSRLNNLAKRVLKQSEDQNTNPTFKLLELLNTHDTKMKEISRINVNRFLIDVANNMTPRTNNDNNFISLIKSKAKSIAERTGKERIELTIQRTMGWLEMSARFDDIEEAFDYLDDRFAGAISERRSKIISNDILQTSGNELISTIGNEADKLDDRNTYKVWMTQRDAKVRSMHREAQGQEVLNDDSFYVGGELLRYPGDPNGSPANTINCRCFIKIIRRKSKNQ